MPTVGLSASMINVADPALPAQWRAGNQFRGGTSAATAEITANLEKFTIESDPAPFPEPA